MAGQETSKKAGSREQAGTPHPQSAAEQAKAAAAPRPKEVSPQQLLGGWRAMLRDVRARAEHKQLGPDASAAVDGFFDELEAQTEERGLSLAEHMQPAARRLLGGLAELVREVLPELPDVHQVGLVGQGILSAWLAELTAAIHTGDVSRLAQLHAQTAAAAVDLTSGANAPGLEEDEAQQDQLGAALAYPMAFYTVKSGPGAGQRRPAIIVAQEEETGHAELEVFFRLSDRPHEPRGELVAVHFGTEPGQWHTLEEEPAESPEAAPLPS